VNNSLFDPATHHSPRQIS